MNRIHQAHQKLLTLKSRIEDYVFGQGNVVDQLIVALIARGHILIEGVPGIAKTLLVKVLARLINTEFGRIQLTPDMLPSDILGTSIWDKNSNSFELSKGPIFTSLLLADEINRTPPKTQSALLQAMEEREISLDGKTFELPNLFTVVATQNPIEFEGTYPLPEAQLDRFMLKINVAYPDKNAEKMMLLSWHEGKNHDHIEFIEPTIDEKSILDIQQLVHEIKVDDSIINYLLALVRQTRSISSIKYGASPRAANLWLSAAKAYALLNNKEYVTPDDIKSVAPSILEHRLVLAPEAELDGMTPSALTTQILNQIPVPR